MEDVEGIGPTYAGRLREAGIRSVTALAVTMPETIAEAADATRDQARRWIASADELADRGGASGEVGTPLETIKGVGPTYARRLRQAGFRGIADLADSNVTAVAEAAGVSVEDATNWVEQADTIEQSNDN
nr:helix-hairpin-helix domain-containing protein [Halomicroarcula nitratireducens]